MKKYITLIIMMLFAVSSYAAGVRLHVEGANGRSIGVGDLFYIIYEVSDISASPDQPSSIPGGKVAYFTLSSQKSSYSSINGHSSQSIKATYTLTARATKEGKFTFGPVNVGGVRSNAVSYTIGKASKSGAANSSQGSIDNATAPDKPKFIGKGDGNLFLRASVSKSLAYEQEALVYTLKLYTTYDAVKFIGATAAPKFEGFVVEESNATSSQFSYETYQGKTYATAVIARYIIFPQMTGSLKVLGNTYTVSVDQREYYHEPFWGTMSVSKPLQLNVTPNDLLVTVKPLPSPKPADFSGGVGEMGISSQLVSKEFRTNQAASIVYTVSGSGNLKYVKLPDLNSLYPSQLEVYTPATKVNTQVGADNVSGSVRFDCSFMPLEEGEFRIPDVKLVYFNPKTGNYETRIAKGYTIKVGKGSASSKSQRREKAVFNPKLMPMSGQLSQCRTLYVDTFWYWLLYVIPFFVLVFIMIFYRHYIKVNSDAIAVRSRKANKMAKRRLRKAYVCMQKGNSSEFYDEVLHALWGYVGDKLKMPASELSRDNIRGEMSKKGIGSDEIDHFINLIDDCEFARYSPSDSSLGLSDVFDRAMSLINEIEQTIKNNKQNVDDEDEA